MFSTIAALLDSEQLVRDTLIEMREEELRKTVAPEDSGARLDVVLPCWLKAIGRDCSRSQVQGKIKAGAAHINGKVVLKPRTEVVAGDEVVFNLVEEVNSVELLAEEMDLQVLYEDQDIIVINKANGVVVHPGSGNERGTLLNGLLHHCKGQLSVLADEGRPGIVHRLDKDTSGCLVAAKTDLAYQSLVAQFSSRETDKRYVAIANGVPAATEGWIENQIGRHPVNRQKMTVLEPTKGKTAITEYRVSNWDESQAWSWIDCKIHTGRTHQIRVHLKESLHCPILGDIIYAQPKRQKTKVSRLMLHARRLEFRHPRSAQMMTFEAELPPEFHRFAIA